MISMQHSLMQRFLFVIMILVCLFLFGAGDASSMLAQSVSNNARPNAPERLGAISGAVLDPAEKPVVGVTVSAYLSDGFFWNLHKTTKTDAGGHYRLDRLSTGIYRVGFSDEAGRYRDQYFVDTPSLSSAADIAVVGDDVTVYTATLQLRANIIGNVLAPDNAVISLLSVALYRRGATDWMWQNERNWYTPSQRQFSFIFGQLESGFYTLRTTATLDGVTYEEYFDNAFSLATATPLSLTVGSAITNVQILIGENPAGATLAGRVTNAAGAPLPAITVTAYQTTTLGWVETRTVKSDNNGNYQARLLAPLPTLLRFYDERARYAAEYFNDALTEKTATLLMPAAGETINNLDVQLAPTGAISGRITRFDGLTPLSASLYLYDNTAVDRNRYLASYFFYRDRDGQLIYKATGLAAGSYYLRAVTDYQTTTLDEFYQDATRLTEATLVTVLPGQTTEAIDFVLGERATVAIISGRVTSNDNLPLRDIAVEAALANTFTIFSTKTTMDGSYQLTVTVPGTYTVRFNDAAGLYRTAYYDNAEQLLTATPLVLSAGENRTAVNASLSSLGQIQGTVSLYDGTRPGSLDFELHRLEEDRWQQQTRSPLVDSNSAVVTFTFRSLLPGLYRVGTKLSYSTEMTRMLYYSNTFDFNAATDIPITVGGRVRGLAFVLGEDKANARIEGLVLADTTPVAGVRVELYQRIFESYWPLLVYTSTDEAGRFGIDGLKAGRYRISFYAPTLPDLSAKPIFWGGGSDLERAAIITLNGTGVTDASIVLSRPYRFYLPLTTR